MYVCGLEHVRNLLSWTRDNLAEVTDILRAREDGRAPRACLRARRVWTAGTRVRPGEPTTGLLPAAGHRR